MYYVYILKCSDETLYTGITTDIVRRLNEHNYDDKRGAKYTRSRRPVMLSRIVPYKNRSEASKEEYRIKQLTREEKLKLVWI